jgi:Flp pilus assembly pilin Flp
MRIDREISLGLFIGLRELLQNQHGQDLIEYALIAGFVATAVVTMSDSIAESFTTVMSRVNSIMIAAGSS